MTSERPIKVEADPKTRGGTLPYWSGSLQHVFVCGTAGEEMHELQHATLVAGRGIDGDRYFLGTGHYSDHPHPDRQITLIEQEALDALHRDHGIHLGAEESRRNLVTVGVPLNHLVGKRFTVGDIMLYGGRLNTPCMYLEQLIGKPVFDPLIHRSGLNCRILTSGRIHRGDPILPVRS